MNTIEEFRTDAPVTLEQYRVIDDAVKIAAKKGMIGRRLMPIYGPLGFGKQAVTHYNLTEIADASLNFGWKISKSEDIVNLVPETLNIPTLDRTFRINRRSLEASRTHGVPLDTTTAISAAYKVAKLEDELIIQGYSADGTKYDLLGLHQVNITNKIQGSQWTAAPEDAITDTRKGIAYLMAQNIDPPYNWVLHPDQWSELSDVGAAKHMNAIVLDTVRKQLMGGDIYWSTCLSTGTGFMMAAGDRGYFNLGVGVDVTTEVEIMALDEGRDLFGVVYECVVPRIFQSTAIVPFDTL